MRSCRRKRLQQRRSSASIGIDAACDLSFELFGSQSIATISCIDEMDLAPAAPLDETRQEGSIRNVETVKEPALLPLLLQIGFEASPVVRRT